MHRPHTARMLPAQLNDSHGILDPRKVNEPIGKHYPAVGKQYMAGSD
jgi:hypothetical protein